MSGSFESFVSHSGLVGHVAPEVSLMTRLRRYLSSCLSPFLVLFAMKEDNEKVPTLLTDYILKGKSSPRPPGTEAVLWSSCSRQGTFPACPLQIRPGRSQGNQGQLWGFAVIGFAFGCCQEAAGGDSITPESPQWLSLEPQTNKGLTVKILQSLSYLVFSWEKQSPMII